ncbi:MAG: hypothetical protein JWO07_678 [Candidatus Saccharibacteria bacterium]|nr:hypothetical protein [Candidatus Saccharibacteria bacterium]
MAEWLGHLMIGWPTWLIGLAAIAIMVIGTTIAYYSAHAIHNIEAFHSKEIKHDKTS